MIFVEMRKSTALILGIILCLGGGVHDCFLLVHFIAAAGVLLLSAPCSNDRLPNSVANVDHSPAHHSLILFLSS